MFKLGTNLGFAINRYIEPEVWAKICDEDLDVRYVQFVADLLNCFLPEDYVKSQVKRIKEATKAHDLQIASLFTSAYTRVNHLLHPDAEARKIWLDWFFRYMEIGSEFGATTFGSHFGILTFDVYNDPKKREYIIEEGIKNWQRLSKRAKELGYESLIFEPMSVPREMATTVEDTQDLLDRVNADCGVPLKVCLDVGHAPDPSQRDPYFWVERLAAVSPVIHLQQTVLNKSNHAPFLPETNKDGIVKGEKLIPMVEAAGNTDALFLLEISHREHHDTDYRVIPDLAESVRYWRQWIKE